MVIISTISSSLSRPSLLALSRQCTAIRQPLSSARYVSSNVRSSRQRHNPLGYFLLGLGVAVSGLVLAPSIGIDLLRIPAEDTTPRWRESDRSPIPAAMPYADT